MDARYSLDKLRDIIVPDAPPIWPPAPGFWLLLVILIAAISILVFQWHRVRKANAYRRAGVALLKEAATMHDVSVILKRVALASFPREQVASLYGDDWSGFLQQTCSECDFSPLVQAAQDVPASDELKRQADVWIRRHRTKGDGGGN